VGVIVIERSEVGTAATAWGPLAASNEEPREPGNTVSRRAPGSAITSASALRADVRKYCAS